MRIKNGIDWIKAKLFLMHIGMGSMASAAEFMAQRAVAYAPVDTGFLAYNIQVSVNNNDVTAQVVSKAYYSAWVEFGHFLGTDHGQTRIYVAPRPFMRPALDDTIREFPEIVRRYSTTAPYDASSAGDHLTTNLAAF